MKRLAAFVLLAGCGGTDRRPEPRNVDWTVEGRTAVEVLKEMLRFDTINPPQPDSRKKNADETTLLKWVKGVLAADGVESEIVESAPGRGNLVARIKGKGGQRPLLLMAHVDVVNVDPRMWEVDPLSAIEKDGLLWGRGALDDKGWAACAVQVMRLLARQKPSLERDVILMLNADEESAGSYGAKFMVEKCWSKIDCEFVLNEGGRTTLKDGKIVTVNVQSAEKIYNDFRLWIRGESGHSSVPRKKNAIYDMARILAKLETFSTPLEVQPTPAAWFAAVSDSPAYAEWRDLMKAAAKGDLDAAAKLAENVEFNAQLRTTFVPTIVKSGIRENVLPPDIEVNFNARLLPGRKLDDLLHALAKYAGLEGYEIVDIEPDQIADWKAKNPAKNAAFFVVSRDVDAPASPLDTPAYEAIRRVAADLLPGVPVVPSMSAGATDSRFFRSKGVTCYGIHPCPTSDEERATVHNHNERVRVDSVIWGVRFLYELTVAIAK